MGGGHFVHRFTTTEFRVQGRAQHTCEVHSKRQKHLTGNTVKKLTAMYCQQHNIQLCKIKSFQGSQT